MVYAGTVLDGIAEALDSVGAHPEAVKYATLELDDSGEHANVSLPVIEIAPTQIERNTDHNTNKVGYETNDDGERIGRIYEYGFDMILTVDHITAPQTRHTSRTLEQQTKEHLGIYDTRMIDADLPHPETGSPLSSVNIVVGADEPANNFSSSPSLRIERLTLSATFTHEIRETELRGAQTPITAVQTPSADGTNPDGTSAVN